MIAVTVILNRVQQRDPKAAEELLYLVYDELRRMAAARMAREAAGHTLQPPATMVRRNFRIALASSAPRPRRCAAS